MRNILVIALVMGFCIFATKAASIYYDEIEIDQDLTSTPWDDEEASDAESIETTTVQSQEENSDDDDDFSGAKEKTNNCIESRHEHCGGCMNHHHSDDSDDSDDSMPREVRRHKRRAGPVYDSDEESDEDRDEERHVTTKKCSHVKENDFESELEMRVLQFIFEMFVKNLKSPRESEEKPKIRTI